MQKKSTQIVVQFKDIPMNLYYGNGNTMHPNLLVIHIQPDEGITLHLNARKLGGGTFAQPIKLDYCHNCGDDINTRATSSQWAKFVASPCKQSKISFS